MKNKYDQLLPKTWKVRRLDEVANIFDSLHKTPTYSEKGKAMVRVTDVKGGFLDLTNTLRVSENVFQEFTHKYIPKRGDIVISRVGSYGNSSYVNTEEFFCLGQNTALISPQINGRFLHQFLQSTDARYQIDQAVVGSTQKTISLKSISSIRVPVPPIEELEAIAHILGTLDDKIELNCKQNETLEAMARALFKAWFVDFEPVHAKMEGRWQCGQSLPGLPAHLYDLFPDRLVDSELGEIPKGWEVEQIGDLIIRHSVGRKYDQKTALKEGQTPILDQGKSGIIGYHNDEPGVIATKEMPIAVFANHTCLMRLISYPFSAIQNVLPFTGKDLPTIWIFYATLDKQPFIEYKGHWPDFVQHKIVVPTKDLACEYMTIIHNKLLKKWQNERSSKVLSQLRDTLLPKLISGELRVPGTETAL